MKSLIWTDIALLDYHENIGYLLREWSESVAIEFVEETESILFSLRKGSLDYKDSNYRNIKECVICKQITLYYRHISKQEVEILRFWNNSMDKTKLKL